MKLKTNFNKITGYWYSPDMGYFRNEGDEYIFTDGRKFPNDIVIRMIPVSKEEYEQVELLKDGVTRFEEYMEKIGCHPLFTVPGLDDK